MKRLRTTFTAALIAAALLGTSNAFIPTAKASFNDVAAIGPKLLLTRQSQAITSTATRTAALNLSKM